METKKEIRTRLLAYRDALPEETCHLHARCAAEKLFQHPAFLQCHTLFTYISFRREIDTFSVIEKARLLGIRTAVPRVEGKEMQFYPMVSFASLKKNRFGILEPPEGMEPVVPQEGDLMLVPGAAFDRRGYRIGYGGGYYDRYLKRYPKAYTIGLAYEFQILDELPAEAFDVAADEVLFG